MEVEICTIGHVEFREGPRTIDNEKMENASALLIQACHIGSNFSVLFIAVESMRINIVERKFLWGGFFNKVYANDKTFFSTCHVNFYKHPY